jgi:hypothetical protein
VHVNRPNAFGSFVATGSTAGILVVPGIFLQRLASSPKSIESSYRPGKHIPIPPRSAGDTGRAPARKARHNKRSIVPRHGGGRRIIGYGVTGGQIGLRAWCPSIRLFGCGLIALGGCEDLVLTDGHFRAAINNGTVILTDAVGGRLLNSILRGLIDMGDRCRLQRDRGRSSVEPRTHPAE